MFALQARAADTLKLMTDLISSMSGYSQMSRCSGIILQIWFLPRLVLPENHNQFLILKLPIKNYPSSDNPERTETMPRSWYGAPARANSRVTSTVTDDGTNPRYTRALHLLPFANVRGRKTQIADWTGYLRVVPHERAAIAAAAHSFWRCIARRVLALNRCIGQYLCVLILATD